MKDFFLTAARNPGNRLTKATFSLVAAGLVLFASASTEAQNPEQRQGGSRWTPAQKCEALKLAATADDLKCRLREERRAFLQREEPRYWRCDRVLEKAFRVADRRYGDACPTRDDGSWMAETDSYVSQELARTLANPDYVPFNNIVHPCKTDAADFEKLEQKLGEYSPECADYLKQCTQEAWFYDAGEDLASSFLNENVEHWLPVGVGNDLLERNQVINEKARRIREYYEGEASLVDPRYAKSIGIGFRHHPYLGVYNCQTDFQKDNFDTGCPLYRAFAPGATERTFLGVVRNYDENDANCIAVGPEPEVVVDDSVIIGQDDFKLSCLPKLLNRNAACAFEIWPWTTPLIPWSDWAYICTQIQPEFAFDPVYRPWYMKAKAAFDSGEVPSGTAIFMPPYENYGTGEPIFGSVTPFADVTGAFAGVVLSIEYMVDELTYTNLIPQCDKTSRDYDKHFHYRYPPRE